MDGVELTTARLRLRPWEPGDATAVRRVADDPEIVRWTNVPHPYGADDARTWVEHQAPAQWTSGTGAPFAVLDATSGALLGSIALMNIADNAAEVGFFVAAATRGRGVMTEALTVVCRWGFDELRLQRITWLAYVGNDASRRVAEKAGFRFEGTLRQFLPQRGTRRDAWIAGLLPDDL